MKTRIISGICMVPLLLIIYFGGLPLMIAAAVIGLIGVTEFYNGWNAIDVRPSRKIAYTMTVILYVGYLMLGVSPTAIVAWLVLAIMMSMIYGWDITNRGPYDAVTTLTGIVYIVFFPFTFVLIDNTDYSELTWVVILASFGSDIAAYFVGRALGKHKLAPNLSPKKTVEGAVGGVLGSMLATAVFAEIVMPDYLAECLLLGAIGGIAAECGDLTASSFKRKMGIKDYGNLIPGHGGIMDRFDSVIFTAPVIYFYIIFVLG
jgi:phosphatidate cytidylyltransferase